MNLDRTVLTDAMWERVEPLLSGKATDPGLTADNRFLEAALWRFRTGAPCEIFRAVLAIGTVISGAFAGGCRRDFLSVFSACYLMISINRIGRRHDHASPCQGFRIRKRGSCEGIGRSKGGLTSKIVALTDAIGKLIRFVVLPARVTIWWRCPTFFRTLPW